MREEKILCGVEKSAQKNIFNTAATRDKSQGQKQLKNDGGKIV